MEKIDIMWQVCELEESSDTGLSIFERFSVVSVPEIWISLLENGTLVCFWPTVDTMKKIRSLHVPQSQEKCAYYKCRILLDGAKFATYKKAKKAELIAQNVSSLMDSSVMLDNHQTENVCESTMDFDVIDADMESNENAVTHSYGFNVTSVDDEEIVDIVGNDTFDYNKSMLKWRSVHSKQSMAMAFDVENIVNELSPNETDTFDYTANFENGENFLTSTVIDEVDCSKSIKTFDVSDILLKITEVKSKLSSFVSDIISDLDKSKEILLKIGNERGSIVQQTEATISSNDVMVVISSVPESKDQSADENKASLSLGNDELNVQPEEIGELPLKPQTTVTPMKGSNYGDASDDIQNFHETFGAASVLVDSDTLNVQSAEIVDIPDHIQNINETFVAKAVHFSDTLSVQRPKFEILSTEYLPCTRNVPVNVNVVPVSDVPMTRNLPMDVKAVESQTQNAIKLPVNSIEGYTRNEDLLEEDVYEKALINHLAPSANENESTYMNRSILNVFEKNFLLDVVSWKKQSGRINIKNSNLMSCWMESCQDNFDGKLDLKKFQEHFRRIKSALRAATKADLKRRLNEKPKKM